MHLDFKSGNNWFTLTEGDFFLIPPEFRHSIKAGRDLTYFCFHFDIDDPDLKIQLIRGLDYYNSCNSKLCQKISKHLKKLDSLVNEKDFDFNTKMIIQIELSKILQSFYEISAVQTSSTSSTRVEYSRIIADYLKEQLTNQVLSYIKNGYTDNNDPLNVESAIKSIGISNGYGFRIFKESYGISPREYLTKIKINEARKLLLKPTYTVEDISLALGYSSVSNFSRQFKRWTGESPIKFRKASSKY